jgi:hypothetical protein
VENDSRDVSIAPHTKGARENSLHQERPRDALKPKSKNSDKVSAKTAAVRKSPFESEEDVEDSDIMRLEKLLGIGKGEHALVISMYVFYLISCSCRIQ